MKSFPRLLLFIGFVFSSTLFAENAVPTSPLPLNQPVEIFLKQEIQDSDILTGVIRSNQNGWLEVELGKTISMVQKSGERLRVEESESAWIPIANVALIKQRIRTSITTAAPNPTEVLASAYFDAVVSGDPEKANTLIDAPFSMNGSILPTKVDVEAFHKELFEQNGKHPIPKYSIALSEDAPALPKDIHLDYVAFQINFETTNILIYVSGGTSPKVIGLKE